MRGTLPLRINLGRRTRIIPADAGNTPYGCTEYVYMEDHPRGCGEHIQAMRATVSREGSSPRMRGTHHHILIREVCVGIIPADAGNTHTWLPTWANQGGSSPRMRGTLPSMACVYPAARIIPADAGNTISWIKSSFLIRDHPRGCGEHIYFFTLLVVWLRIIPADAGNTFPSSFFRLPVPGSSPRMRGTRDYDMANPVAVRIIPADAGNTLKDPCNPNNMIDKISDF